MPDPENRSLTPIEALLRAAVRLLADASRTPRLDAELLLAHCLGSDRTALFIRREEAVSAAQTERFRSLLEARRAGRPVAQLIGEKEFWSLSLRITADVLTPRPETELLVERALTRLPADRPASVLDLGTGSGAVALALATERPLGTVTATDFSPAALALAGENARRLAIGNVRFTGGDWFAAVPGERFDVIVSNPPYVAEAEWASADRELDFEPRAALAAGSDGLQALRVIVRDAPEHLPAGGALLLEHGASQGPPVRALLAAAGFEAIMTSDDLARRPRVTEGMRRR